MTKKQIEYILDNTHSHASASFEAKFRLLFTGNKSRSAFTEVLEKKTEEEINAIEAVLIAYERVIKDLRDTEKRLRKANDDYGKLHNEARRNKNTVDSLNFMIHQLHPVGDEY